MFNTLLNMVLVQQSRPLSEEALRAAHLGWVVSLKAVGFQMSRRSLQKVQSTQRHSWQDVGSSEEPQVIQPLYVPEARHRLLDTLDVESCSLTTGYLATSSRDFKKMLGRLRVSGQYPPFQRAGRVKDGRGLSRGI